MKTILPEGYLAVKSVDVALTALLLPIADVVGLE
jgi:hypothetical protein